MKSPDLKDEFIYRGAKIDVAWFDVVEKSEIPNLEWHQVYGICDLDGEVPIVFYAHARENLPGGHTEAGETLEETLIREIREELNCEVLEWQPIGYQILSSPEYGVENQFRVYAKLHKLGEWQPDIGGSVKGYRLVELKDLNSRIQYGVVGERMVEIVSRINPEL